MVEEKMIEKVKKRTNWYIFKKKCPFCENMSISSINKYRRKWYRKSNGQWELKEERLNECNSCKKSWWT